MKVIIITLVIALSGTMYGSPLKGQPLEEEMSGKFEGDIVLTDNQYESIFLKRTGLLNMARRWTFNIVPYTLEVEAMTQEQITAIRAALDEMEETLCLHFIERTTERDYVRVTVTDSGCYSYLGRIGGAQQLNLQSNEPGVSCFRHGTIMHEFIHALGFHHMHSATDRDQYVRIVWENIQAGTESNFNTYDSDYISQFQVPYDYGSVMHYSAFSGSINGEATIVALDEEAGQAMGQRLGMSEYDIRRINNMYC